MVHILTSNSINVIYIKMLKKNKLQKQIEQKTKNKKKTEKESRAFVHINYYC